MIVIELDDESRKQRRPSAAAIRRAEHTVILYPNGFRLRLSNVPTFCRIYNEVDGRREFVGRGTRWVTEEELKPYRNG